VEEAIPRSEALLADVAGDRATESVILSSTSVLRAMEGSFDEARSLYRAGQSMMAELGVGLAAQSSSIDSSRVELLAGDLAAAERELRRDYDALTALDETYFRSTIAAYLARVRLRQGDAEEATTLADVAARIADADDVLTNVPLRSARAMLLALRDQPDDARREAIAAVDLARATSQIHLLAEALADLGDVLVAVGEEDTADAAFREADELFTRKGDVVSAVLLRARLEETALQADAAVPAPRPA
jgi:ATP/maltotriose-dependent transcriptional regulator MalT